MIARKLALAALGAVSLLAAVPAHADYYYGYHDGWRERHWREEARERAIREQAWREQAWREREWRERHRAWEYRTAPPPYYRGW